MLALNVTILWYTMLGFVFPKIMSFLSTETSQLHWLTKQTVSPPAVLLPSLQKQEVLKCVGKRK